MLYSDGNLFKQIYRLLACARENLVSGINKSNKSACAIYLILDKKNSISPGSCHYITREQAYSGNEIAIIEKLITVDAMEVLIKCCMNSFPQVDQFIRIQISFYFLCVSYWSIVSETKSNWLI
jgi:hypothetical protein